MNLSIQQSRIGKSLRIAGKVGLHKASKTVSRVLKPYVDQIYTGISFEKNIYRDLRGSATCHCFVDYSTMEMTFRLNPETRCYEARDEHGGLSIFSLIDTYVKQVLPVSCWLNYSTSRAHHYRKLDEKYNGSLCEFVPTRSSPNPKRRRFANKTTTT